MKTLPTGMQADLDSGATTHCLCWQLTLNNGVIIGATDHDEDVVFDSITHYAETGFTATAVEQSTGLNVDSQDVMGVLNSASITEQDIAARLYDSATVQVYRVDWQDTDKRVIIMAGSVGEVSRGRVGFTAEVRSLAHAMNQPRGRSYNPICDAVVGDSRCKINLNGTSPGGFAYKVTSTVTHVQDRHIFRMDQAAVQAVPDDWFTRGKALWNNGANNGIDMEIKQHREDGSRVTFILLEAVPYDIGVGDSITLTVGCDHTIETCKAKFDNVLNFRGFPRIPGQDIILKTAIKADANQGGSLFT